jgi:hypothetical protein
MITKLNEKSLRAIGFVTEGSEWGDDGALEIYDNPQDLERLFIWVPKKQGRYIDPQDAGFYIEHEYQLVKTHVKTIEDVKVLFKLLTGKDYDKVWKPAKTKRTTV